MKKPELVKIANKIKDNLEKEFIIDFDVSGSIGKRYLRSAEVGIPCAITIDFDSLNDKSVTVRDRDSEQQIRVKISDLRETIRKLMTIGYFVLIAGVLIFCSWLFFYLKSQSAQCIADPFVYYQTKLNLTNCFCYHSGGIVQIGK